MEYRKAFWEVIVETVDSIIVVQDTSGRINLL